MISDYSIDAVIAYVDSSDEKWQGQLSTYAVIENEEINPARFRSYNTLPLLVKCIRKFMPFIDNVFIIISDCSQIPKNIDTSVKFILHKEIIPNQILPVFNSQAIEPFIHKIPNLSEHFIYFNDDMFPIKPLSIEDFYRKEKPVWRIKHWNMGNITNGFRNVCMNSFLLANAMFNSDNRMDNIIVPFHSISPMFKSDCDEIFNKYKEQIIKGITKFRKPWNVNQYLFSVYSILKRGYEQQDSNFFKYVLVSDAECWKENLNSLGEIPYKVICINDTKNDTNIEKHINIIQNRLLNIL